MEIEKSLERWKADAEHETRRANQLYLNNLDMKRQRTADVVAMQMVIDAYDTEGARVDLTAAVDQCRKQAPSRAPPERYRGCLLEELSREDLIEAVRDLGRHP